jgi:PAS domain S-box-containing protein
VRRPSIVLLLTLALAAPASAQIPSAIDADSIEAALPGAEGEARVDLLNLLSTHFGEFDPPRGERLAREALAAALELDYPLGEARALENIGQAHYFQGRYVAALDSLNHACSRLAVLGEGRLHGYCRVKRANVYNRQQRIDEAVVELAQGRMLLHQAGDEAGVGHVWNNVGWIRWRVGDFAGALNAYARAREIRERLGQKRYLAATLNNMGIIHYQWGRYAPALENYLASLAIREELGDVRGQALVNNNIGKIYQDWGDLTRAREFYEVALPLSEESGSTAALGYTLYNLGSALEQAGDLTEAQRQYERSLAAYRDLEDASGISLLRTAQARIHNARGEFPAALPLLRESLQEARDIEHREREAESLLHLGIARAGLGDTVAALGRLREGQELAAGMEKRDLLLDIHLRLSHLLEERGRTGEALEQLRAHNALRDSLFASRLGQQLADMQARYETERLRREALAQEQRLAERSQQQQLTTLGVAFLLILAAGLAVAMRRQNATHEALRREMAVRADAEEALREREETFRSLTDNLPVGVCRIEVHPRFQMTEANPEIVRMFDYDNREEMIAASTKEIFGTPRERFGLFRQIVSGEPIALTELTVRTRRGRHFIGALTASAPFEGAKGVRYVDGIIEDITERHEFEQALRTARDEAEAANRAKTTFLANMSHEIRTPLNAILGYAQILRADAGLSEKQRRAIETVESSGDHLLSLINDILDISKIEAGFQELHEEDFHLAELLQDLGRMFELRCRQKGLAWSLEADLTHERVCGDEGKLRQVLINLLGNAVKFTDEGRVDLRVRRVDGRSVRFEVSDTGPGIAADRQADVFEPFQQEGAAAGGTGLGLAIARDHVRLMGGELTLESVQGEGAAFRFAIELPPSRGAPSAAGDQDYSKALRLQAGQSVRALVVDDVRENREVLAQMLAAVGVQVTSADDGEEGLALVQQESFDIVLADIRMPGMRGDEMRRRIVEHLGASAPKIVAVTASAMEHQRRQFLDEGFDAFIDKPFRRAHIYASLAELLGVRFDMEQIADTVEVDLGQLRLDEATLHELHEAGRSHNLSQLRAILQRLTDAGGASADLAAHLRQISGGFDMKALRMWLEANAATLTGDDPSPTEMSP